MYNVLLQSSKLVDSSKSTSTETNMANDGDDVYYHFGGVTLSTGDLRHGSRLFWAVFKMNFGESDLHI